MKTPPKVNKVRKLIVAAAHDTAGWFQHETTLQWKHAPIWVELCGTIPAFAFVVTFESLRCRTAAELSAHFAFFKQLEDALFDFYETKSDEYLVPISQCLPLAAERQTVCSAIGELEETYVSMRMVLGILFPNRSDLYQMDWAVGFPSKGFGAPAEYAAMRLAADLTGIPTPRSLAEHTAAELGIRTFGNALTPMQDFACEYAQRIA